MNQVTNLIQWKNLTDEQKAGYDFENYVYEFQIYKCWVKPMEKTPVRHPDGDHVYRLVIQPDTWYFIADDSADGVYLGSDLFNDADNIDTAVVIRPATADEIPKRVFKDGAHYAVMYKSNDEDDVAQYDADNNQFDTIKFGTCRPEAFSWIGEELKIEWGKE